MIALTNDTFDEAVKSTDKCLVDFWAEWCGPCKAMNPILEEINEDVITVFKVDSDSEMLLAKNFEVRSIPTMIIFEDGVEVKRLVGARGKNQLIEEIHEQANLS